jgi:DNA-binding NtrC family response regulator
LLVTKNEDLPFELDGLFSSHGFHVSHIQELDLAVHLLDKKFFIVALFDLDTPEKYQGLKLLKLSQKFSPITRNFMFTYRESFKSVVQAYRMGCEDFVFINDNSPAYLLEKIKKCALQVEYENARDILMKDMASLHGNFFKKMLKIHISLMETQEQLRYKDSSEELLPPCSILIVDGDDKIENAIKEECIESKGWNITRLSYGGEALAYIASNKFHIALVNQSLPDLPGTMIVSTLKSTWPESITLMFSEQVPKAELLLFEGSTSKEIPINIGDTKNLVKKLRDIRFGLNSDKKKQQHLQTFKANNFEFIQQYNKVRTKIKELLDTEK